MITNIHISVSTTPTKRYDCFWSRRASSSITRSRSQTVTAAASRRKSQKLKHNPRIGEAVLGITKLSASVKRAKNKCLNSASVLKPLKLSKWNEKQKQNNRISEILLIAAVISTGLVDSQFSVGFHVHFPTVSLSSQAELLPYCSKLLPIFRFVDINFPILVNNNFILFFFL